MALCRIASRSSALSLRASRAGFPITAAKEQVPIIFYGARRQFWSGSNPKKTAKLIEDKLLDILDTKIRAVQESKQELGSWPSSSPFTIEHVGNNVKLERYFGWEKIEVSLTKCEEHLELGVTISRPYDRSCFPLMLQADLKASLHKLEITKLRTGRRYTYTDRYQEAGELDQDLKHGVMKYLKVRGIDKDLADCLMKYMDVAPQIQGKDQDLYWMTKLKTFINNDRIRF